VSTDAAARVTAEDRILTVPNAITALRLALLPVFVWLLLIHDPHERYAAGLLLGLLGISDWVDGYIARHAGQVSTLGKVLDPTADRLLLVTAVVCMLVDGSAPRWLVILVLVRETLVAAATVGLALAGARRIDVRWVGKAGTFALMVALPLFIISKSSASWAGLAGFLAWGFAIPGLALAWFAAVAYVPSARRAVAEGRVGRHRLSAPARGAGS
jgi:CDP-diacylglycerol--glycerol-3-phosphate 3-phosphatidyltransferase